MKLLHCRHCNDFISLRLKYDSYGSVHKSVLTVCMCKKNAGKYLSDFNTAVFTKDAYIVGIDNNGWNDARSRYNSCICNPIKYPSRIDFFFTGWIPTIPGEIIRVNTVQDVRKYPFKVLVEAKHSTMPVSQ